jgi:phosphoglycolate phosphatase
MPYSVVIFDLDGTLLDSLEDLAFAGNQVLERHGYPVHPVDAYKYFVGDGMRTLVERITPDSATEADNNSCFDLFKSLYSKSWNNRTRPYEGVADLLSALRRQGFRLCILSNKPHDFTVMCVEHYFPENTFQLVFGQRPDVPKKPNPEGALEIAKRLDVTPGECIYVGDSRVDMRTGKSAGMFTIGVLWGFRDIAELRENGADMMVKMPMELAEKITAFSIQTHL